MNYKQHLKYGLIFEFIAIIFVILGIVFIDKLVFTFSWIFLIQFIIVIFISPLSPDLDHYNGKLRELWIGLGLMIGLYGIFFNDDYMVKGILLSLIPFSIPYFTSHRGIIHSILFNVIFGGILFLITKDLYITFIGSIGFYSHLWADKILFKVV